MPTKDEPSLAEITNVLEQLQKQVANYSSRFDALERKLDQLLAQPQKDVLTWLSETSGLFQFAMLLVAAAGGFYVYARTNKARKEGGDVPTAWRDQTTGMLQRCFRWLEVAKRLWPFGSTDNPVEDVQDRVNQAISDLEEGRPQGPGSLMTHLPTEEERSNRASRHAHRHTTDSHRSRSSSPQSVDASHDSGSRHSSKSSHHSKSHPPRSEDLSQTPEREHSASSHRSRSRSPPSESSSQGSRRSARTPENDSHNENGARTPSKKGKKKNNTVEKGTSVQDEEK